MASHPEELRASALHWLVNADCDAKIQGVTQLRDNWKAGALTLDAAVKLAPDQPVPGRPARPVMVSPLDVKHRSMRTPEGRAALIHALTHIEFNAINLALDAIWRFDGMPVAFYEDWLRVAAEEAYHFSLLSAHLRTLGFAYGDFDAHNSLWDMAEKTKDDVLARIALVPRIYEARGLDAVPLMRAKLVQAGDAAVGEILDIIMRDEVGHVAIGNQWYGWLCQQRSLEPLTTFQLLAQTYKAPPLRGPYNQEARRQAGFTEEEMRLFYP
jgi:uncharacterized ferritin-like protein (DUF455 family)